MLRYLALASVLGVAGFALAACGSTSYGPGGRNATATPVISGQDTGAQPESGGLKTPSYTSANNVCSLYPLPQLAQQNGLPSNASAETVAKKISSGESNAKDKQAAYQGCLDGINGTQAP